MCFVRHEWKETHVQEGEKIADVRVFFVGGEERGDLDRYAMEERADKERRGQGGTRSAGFAVPGLK